MQPAQTNEPAGLIDRLLAERRRREAENVARRLEPLFGEFRARFSRDPSAEEARWFVDSVHRAEITGRPTPEMDVFLRAWIEKELPRASPYRSWAGRLYKLKVSLSQYWKPRQDAALERLVSSLRSAGVACPYPIEVTEGELPEAKFWVPTEAYMRYGVGITAGFSEILETDELVAISLHERMHGDHDAEHSLRKRQAKKGPREGRKERVAKVERDIEFECDAGAVLAGAHAQALIRALQKLESRGAQLGFRYPTRDRFSALDTHPVLADRIDRINALEGRVTRGPALV